MHTEIVEVVDKIDDKIKVRFSRKPLCGCCKFNTLCGKAEEEVIIEGGDDFVVQKGDKIEVGIEEKQSLLASLLTFLLPAVIFIAVLLLLQRKGELISFGVAIAFLLVYYFLVKLLIRGKDYFKLYVLRKV